jgi:cytochrome c oxidase subunit 1
MYPELPSQIAAVLIFIGFNVTFFTQFVLGSRGMPRRYYDYLPEFTSLHQLSTFGSWILALGLFMVLGTWIYSLWKGEKASANPWGALTLEWTHTTSPPDPHNFHHTPLVTRGPYDYHLADDVFGPRTEGDGAGDGAAVTKPAVH